MLTNMKAG